VACGARKLYSAVKGYFKTHPRAIIRSLWEGVTPLPSAILPHQRYPLQDL